MDGKDDAERKGEMSQRQRRCKATLRNEGSNKLLPRHFGIVSRRVESAEAREQKTQSQPRRLLESWVVTLGYK